MINNSLKEYYVKLNSLYDNAVNMLTAIQQSLTSSSEEISVNVINSDDTSSTYKIPSFLYLENKLEQLDTTMSNLFKMPESGEAWFSNSDNMYKLKLISSGTSPVSPAINSANVTASITDNNILKDMVSPKTYLKLNITNLPNNIEDMYMHKIVVYNSAVFDALQSADISTYDEYKAALFNYTKGADYDEYESTIKLPIKKDLFNSEFQIEEIPELESGNPYLDNNIRKYKIVLNRLTYTNLEDSSIEYTLKAGDIVCLGSTLVLYKVDLVNTSDNSIIIEEKVGHVALQTYDENTDMAFKIYNKDFADYHYVEVPLEENPYIIIFLGTVYNNIRSLFSIGYMFNLNNIMMVDSLGQAICDNAGNQYTYIEYYKKYCTNIGDLILGLTEAAYPQLSNYDNNILNNLQSSDVIKNLVNNSIDVDTTLKVVPINKHLLDDTETEELVNLHTQKSELNAQLKTIQNNIDQTYNTLVTTDFNQDTSISESSLRSQLNEYYTERTTLQKQIISLVDNINTKVSSASTEEIKYRIRGVTSVSEFETYLASLDTVSEIHLIGLEVEYKYKAVSKDTTSVTVINSNVFTDWNKCDNIDRQRYIKFSDNLKSWSLEFVNYDTTTNIIKWNQIDIPITQHEDVVVRIRYKFSVGQPFVNIYSPWSDELTVSFPDEYIDNVEVSSILDTNEDDTIVAKFNNTLINEGYQEHITSNLIAGNHKFLHIADDIYSGFINSENVYLSLKEKLSDMSSELETYKDMLNEYTAAKMQVYVTHGNTEVELFPKSINTFSIYNTEHITDTFIRKEMSIIIKNTGASTVKLYSIFPGNMDIALLESNYDYFERTIGHYERVPIIVNNTATYQVLGQWVYFRQDNPFTEKEIYLNTSAQRQNEISAVGLQSGTDTLKFISNPSDYLGIDNMQPLWGYKKRTEGSTVTYTNRWAKFDFSDFSLDLPKALIKLSTDEDETSETIYDKFAKKKAAWYMYDTSSSNSFILRYEDIKALKANYQYVYLDQQTPIKEFIHSYTNVNYFNTDVEYFNGACLFPNIQNRTSIATNGTDTGYISIESGKSVSIPVVFEYYLDGVTLTSISKSLYFDLRTSLTQEPQHYMLEVSASSDFSASGDLLNTVSLSDEATD